MKIKHDLGHLTLFLVLSCAFVQGGYGSMQIAASGGGSGGSGSVSMNTQIGNSAALNSNIAISGAAITPKTVISGPVSKFEYTHGVTDSTGKSASVYVKVMNAPNGLNYWDQVLPQEGSVSAQPWVSAEQTLTVPKADSIICIASASYGNILSAGAGISETKGSSSGDYVTLTGYDGKAYASAAQVSAVQTATSGSGKSITISSNARDSSGTYRVNTPLSVSFKGLSASSLAGTSTQVSQAEQVIGSFSSTATALSQTKTRTSNFGTKYDLNMRAAKGSSPTGIVGFYVNPTMTLQRAVNAARSGDTINAAAGTYKENVVIGKSLSLIGAGTAKTIVDGNHQGSTITVGQNTGVTLSGMTIQGGTNTYGGGIYNRGTLNLNGAIVSNNVASGGGGIFNWGTLNVNSGSSITNNNANDGGGIDNFDSGILNLNGGSVSNNKANQNSGNGGGILNNGGTVNMKNGIVSGNKAAWGGGVFDFGTMTQSGGSIDHNTAYLGGGIYQLGVNDDNGNTIQEKMLTLKGGSISYNTAIVDKTGNVPDSGAGGGVYADCAGAITLDGGRINGNTASVGGGIFINQRALTFKSGSIDHNIATYGGGVFNCGPMKQTGGSISYNTATKWGGGIYNLEGSLNLNGGSIDHNTAAIGGGILNDGGSITGNTGTVKNNIPDQIAL